MTAPRVDLAAANPPHETSAEATRTTERRGTLSEVREQIEAMPPGRAKGRALLQVASQLRDRDRMGEAATVALQASVESLRAGATIAAAHAWRLAGLSLLLDGRVGEAVTRMREGRDLLAEAKAGAVTLAGLDASLAEALRAIGHPPAARLRLQAARDAYAEGGHDEVLLTCDHDLAVLAGELGESGAAVEELVRVRQAFLDRRDREGVAACSHNLGLLLHDLRELDDSIEYFQEARNVFRAVGREAEAAACDQNIGVVLHDMGRHEEAARRLAEACRSYAAAGAVRSAGECNHNLSVVLTVLGRADEAAAAAKRAADADVRSPDDSGDQPAAEDRDGESTRRDQEWPSEEVPVVPADVGLAADADADSTPTAGGQTVDGGTTEPPAQT